MRREFSAKFLSNTQTLILIRLSLCIGASIKQHNATQTRQWLCQQAESLVKQRKMFEMELSKFMHVTATRENYARHFIFAGADWFRICHNPIDPKFSSGGHLNLRRLVQEVRS